MTHASFFTESGAPIRPWRSLLLVVAVLLVFGTWFGTRVYLFNSFQNANHPSVHPSTRVFFDMAISLDEGHKLGEINVSRFIRNRSADPAEPYLSAAQPGDEYRMYKSLDPGYALVVWASRHIFYFIPDTVMRPVMLQLFLDGVLLAALFFTFRRWGTVPAIAAGIIYSLSIIFALSASTPWYHFWDGLACTFAFLELIWLYRLTRFADSSAIFKILIGCLIGITLGCAVWVRSSWFIFSPLLLMFALFSRRLRPWLIPAILVYAIFAGGMMWRSTALRDGELSYSTRMSWHTAFQALGRHPNPYGLEDDDAYLLSRAYNEDGLDFNLTDYRAEDQAMKRKYLALWEEDAGYIIRSISQRVFSNVIFNFNDNNHPYWNYGQLIIAIAGLFFALWLGGEIGFVGVLAALMYGFINLSYAFVYYVMREYSYPTQMMLLFGNVVAVAGVIELARRLWRREWLNLADSRIGPVNIAFMFFAGLLLFIMLPPVQTYLTPPEVITPKFDSPPQMKDIFYMGLQAQVEMLPAGTRERFLLHARRATTEKHSEMPKLIRAYADQHLYYIMFTNRDGKSGIFWMPKNTDLDAFHALVRASKSIVGVGYDWIKILDLQNPATWEGGMMEFKLLPNPHLAPEHQFELLKQKFATWNWDLEQTGDQTFIAHHNGAGCPPIRQQLEVYFRNQCRGSDEPFKSDDNKQLP